MVFMNSDTCLSKSQENLPFYACHRWAITHTPFKRIFDIVFSLSVLLIASPLFLIIALLVFLSSRGPVLYSQERIGRGGAALRCYKFRTMHHDSQQRLQEILRNDPARRKEWEETYKLKKDPRVTFIGSLLRSTSLDELPQFINVLKGDLSVVGPRPVVKEEIINHFREKAQTIFAVRPGITGLWQVSGRSNTSYSKRIALDETYVKDRSVMQDLKIIALTIPRMISRNGAY
jgi:exopolysaccharide production protein ExoY